MKSTRLTLGLLAMAAAAGVSLAKSANGGGNGTSILHFMVRASFAPARNSPVAGQVDASQNRQGNANNQRFDLQLSGLTFHDIYLVLLSTIDDTNLVEATRFTPDSGGSISLRFMSVGSSKGKGKGNGKRELTEAMDPLAAIRQIVIANSNTQTVASVGNLITIGTNSFQAVASANLGNPASATYLISRPLNQTGADADAAGTLRIKANSKRGDLSLRASGLAPNASSMLWINGSVWFTRTNDVGGNVQFEAKVLTVPQTLEIHTIAVSDANTNLLLTTMLP